MFRFNGFLSFLMGSFGNSGCIKYAKYIKEIQKHK